MSGQSTGKQVQLCRRFVWSLVSSDCCVRWCEVPAACLSCAYQMWPVFGWSGFKLTTLPIWFIVGLLIFRANPSSSLLLRMSHDYKERKREKKESSRVSCSCLFLHLLFFINKYFYTESKSSIDWNPRIGVMTKRCHFHCQRIWSFHIFRLPSLDYLRSLEFQHLAILSDPIGRLQVRFFVGRSGLPRYFYNKQKGVVIKAALMRTDRKCLLIDNSNAGIHST